MGDGVAPQALPTARCPAGRSCETCRGKANLAVIIVQGAAGVFCYTICSSCNPSESPAWSRPPDGVADAYADQVGWTRSTVDRVLIHRGHATATSRQGAESEPRAETLDI